MPTTAYGWRNKKGTADRRCACGTWKQHWINFSNKGWPTDCSVSGCTRHASLGAHVYNLSVAGEKIIPMCTSCNGLEGIFNLNADVTFVSANKSENCGN